MLVLHVGEPMVPPAALRRGAYVPVIAALASAHSSEALHGLYTTLCMGLMLLGMAVYGSGGRLGPCRMSGLLFTGLLAPLKKEGWFLRRATIVLDNVTYNSVVDAFVRFGDVAAACAFVDDPARTDLRDTRTYNIIIKGLAKRGRVEDACAVRDEIRAAGFVPNEVTQNSLVNACVRVGDFPSALRRARVCEVGCTETGAV